MKNKARVVEIRQMDEHERGMNLFYTIESIEESLKIINEKQDVTHCSFPERMLKLEEIESLLSYYCDRILSSESNKVTV